MRRNVMFGCEVLKSNEEKIRLKDRDRIIVLIAVFICVALSLGIPAIVTLGRKLFAITPVLY